MGRLIVGSQKPEYVSAAPKRFAWAIGFALSVYMLVSLVLFGIMTPFNLLVCATCLVLLFLETAFGICVGCLVYNLFAKNKPQNCPGDVCKPKKKEAIQIISFTHLVVLLSFFLVLFIVNPFIQIEFGQTVFSANRAEIVNENCTVPQWAIDIGHEEIYKIHNACE